MTENLLRHEASPYLLQHRDNPVHWRPWGPAALAEATHADKPILLSVGYAACHWCHVMAHESFEDPDTAAVMNRLFVNIKVDREERPDIDQIYMNALHALGEQGGWPLTMFLTPAGAPIWGGTYFPKTSRYGRPGFVTVLKEISRLFREEPDKIDNNRQLIMEHLARRPDTQTIPLDRRLLDEAASRLLQYMDPIHGGTKGAPKFPQTGLFELLWRAGLRTGDRRYREAVLLTLRTICQGGIYDHVGGGFSRYSVDERWLAPHFEKMLYDNAQLLELLTHAYAATGEPLFRIRIEQTIAWLQREMMLPGGAFAASLDADSEGREGKFYVWTPDEVIAILGAEEGAFFADVHDITPAGNWEGVAIPNRLASPDQLPEADEERLARARMRLLSHRETRVRPATDDKILADWNGHAIAALAFAGITLGRPDWIATATGAFRFVTESMTRDGRLAHAYREGKSVFPGLATDYGAMIKGALSLHEATQDPAYIGQAETLTEIVRTHHWDADSPSYYLSADDAEALVIRPRSIADDATASATSLMASNLIRLWHLTGNDAYRGDADAILEASGGIIVANLFATTGLLNALDLTMGAVDVVIVRPSSAPADAILAAVRRHRTPNTILSVHDDTVDLPATHPAAGKTPIDGKATAYVCRDGACSLPVTEPDALAELVRSAPVESGNP